MESFEFLRFPSTPPSITNTQLQSLQEVCTSMPFPFLLDKPRLHPQFTPSSPSPDMEAAVKRFSCSEGSSQSSSSRPFHETDVLMADAYLEYVNEMLMTEEQDCLPVEDDTQASYHALMKSFYDIIAEPLPLDPASSQHAADSVGDNSWPYLSSEIHPMSSRDMTCEGDTGTQTIKSLGNLSSIINSCDVPAVERSGSFENQDNAKSSGSFEHQDISFDELKAHADYASLYVGMLSLQGSTSNESKANCRNKARRNSSRAPCKGAQCVQTGSSVVEDFIDLQDLLVTCAQAVAIGDVKRANQILHDLYHKHGVSIQGNSLQRVAHYFCDALVARMTGTGWQQYQMMCDNKPSLVSILKASRIWYQMIPHFKMMHYFPNQNILKAVAGHARLHILDFGISHGMQWPCLINALADRAEGPPLLVITGIQNSETDKNCLENLKATGRRLSSYAKKYNVPFQFIPLVLEKRDRIDPASLQLQKGEVLVANCVKYLSQLPEEGVDPSLTISPRQKLLMHIRDLNPHLLLMADVSSACGSPFFVSRFREAVHYFHNNQDMLDTVCSDDPDRLWVEQRYYSRCILNIVACEGAERVVRPEPFKQWDLRIKRAGFELLAIPSDVLSRAKKYIKQHYHSDFMLVNEGEGWMLMGWKGRTLQALSAWKPSNLVN